MRKIFLFFVFLPFISSAQSSMQKNEVLVQYSTITSDWVEIYQQDGVIFFVKKIDCGLPSDVNSQELLLFKLENTSDNMFVIDWDIQRWLSNPGSNEQKTIESSINVFLSAGETIEGVCDVESDYFALLTILSKFINQANGFELTQFTLSNIKFSVHEK